MPVVRLCCVFLCCFSVLFSQQSDNGVVKDVRIEKIIGKVELRRGSAAQFRPARPSMRLSEQDALRTFVESEVEIRIEDGTLITIGENSVVEMSQFRSYAQGAEQTSIRIFNGRVFSDVKKLVNNQSSFEFQTPTATAAIRGTQLSLDVTKQRTVVQVHEGEVEVRARGATKSARVKTNQQAEVLKGQKEVAVKEIEKVVPASDSVAIDTTGTDSVATSSTGDDSASTDTTLTASPDSLITEPGTTGTAVEVVPEADSLEPPEPDTSSANEPLPEASDDSHSNAGFEQDSIATVSEDLPADLSLSISEPADGFIVTAQSQLSVSGQVNPADAAVRVQGTAVGVQSDGAFQTTVAVGAAQPAFDILVEAAYHGKITRQRVSGAIEKQQKNEPLTLSVISPVDNQKITKPLIMLQGKTLPGAQVRCSGIEIIADATGMFQAQIPLPDEETSYTLDIEAEFGGKQKTLRRRVYYAPPLKLQISAPANLQTVTGDRLVVTGMVTPASAEVYAAEVQATVSPSGEFRALVPLSADPGTIEIEVIALFDNQEKSEFIQLQYLQAQDLFIPTVQPSSLQPVYPQGRVIITAIDRTPDDLLTLFISRDGQVDEEKISSAQSYTIELDQGKTELRYWAEDSHGNKSSVVSGEVAYLISTSWQLRMSNPAGGRTLLRLPPSGAPGQRFDPLFTLEFSLENIPNDDLTLIKNVFVVNLGTGAVLYDDSDPFDIDFAVDAPVTKGQNSFEITVRDINDYVKVENVIVEIR